MPAIPIFQRAAHITTITIAGCTVAANGDLTAGSAVSIKAKLTMLDDQIEPQHDEINPITSGRLNNVLIADGWRVRLEILNVNDGTDPDVFMTAIYSYDIIKLIYVVGTATNSIGTKTLYGVRGTKGLSTNGRSALKSTLDLLCVDVGATDFVKWTVA